MQAGVGQASGPYPAPLAMGQGPQDLPCVGAPSSSTGFRAPFIITWPLDKEVPSFPIAWETEQIQVQLRTRPCPAVPPILGRGLEGEEGGLLPYLIPGDGEPALAARREVAVHPSEALLLVVRVG